MDFDAAMAAHADWKVNLRVALVGKTTVDAEKACSDRNCALGRWLHGDARSTHGSDRNYLQCVEAHREFHEAAGEVARSINNRDYERAEKMLEGGSRFSDASLKVAVAVRRMKACVPA